MVGVVLPECWRKLWNPSKISSEGLGGNSSKFYTSKISRYIIVINLKLVMEILYIPSQSTYILGTCSLRIRLELLLKGKLQFLTITMELS